MRCIEIEQYLLQKMEHKGLTLTWDVLKSKNEKRRLKQWQRLTLTWDVLKCA